MIARQKPASDACVRCCVLVIAAISVHDAALVVLNDDVIEHTERNPLGRWLIATAGGQVWFFVAAKLAGTTTVCTVILALQKSRPTTACTVAHVMAGMQLLLLGYLTFC